MDFAAHGLHRRPFRTTPDAAAYCPTDAHESTAAAVARAFRGQGGVAVVDGPPGTGKTLLGMRFLEALPDGTTRVVLPSARYAKPAELFQGILFDLGRPFTGLGEHELRLAVHDELLTALAAGRPVVLFADEAHHLSAEVCEELRLLGNLETTDAKALFVLLAGLPPLTATTTGAFAQRVSARSSLAPLTRDEAVRFVRHQLRECGGRPEKLIDDEALALIADRAGGVPRVINRVAALAFELAADAGNPQVDAEATLEALRELGLAGDDTADAGDVVPMTATARTEPEAPPRPPAKRKPTKRKSA